MCITGCHNDVWGPELSPAVQAINDQYLCHVHTRSDYFTALTAAGLVPITVADLTEATIQYWELRARSTVATGIEQAFLNAYQEHSFQYLLVAADRT